MSKFLRTFAVMEGINYDKTKFEPVIKWSGSKRSQCFEIVEHMPKYINTYYEPFLGGGSVMRALLQQQSVKGGISVDRFICSDLNEDLIDLWRLIKNNPKYVADKYEQMWHEMNDGIEDRALKRTYFENVRERFNHGSFDEDIDLRAAYFLFIMRTTTNGMPRYSRDGFFNNSFHITRDGINPERLRRIINEWSELLSRNDVTFKCCSYRKLSPQHGDFMYLDPPYAGTNGMYFGGFDNKPFFEWLSECECGYLLSYDGKAGAEDHTYDVPKRLYDSHEYIRSGNSSFRRVIGNDRNAIVHESLYVKKK